MLETRAVVVLVGGRGALVRADQGNGCGQCNGKGCGTSALSQLFCSKPRQFQVENPINANIGDEVIVAVAQGAVLRSISLVYGLPLLMLFIFAALGSWLGSQHGHTDGYAAAGGLLGLIVGFILVKVIATLQARNLSRPYIVRRCAGENAN